MDAEATGSQVLFNPPLHCQRYNYIFDFLFKHNPRIERLADFGCAKGLFVRRAKQLPFLTQLFAVDIHDGALEQCSNQARPLAWDYIFGRGVPLDISLIKTDVTLKDSRFRGLDCIVAIELIEHLSPKQLQDFPEAVFGYYRPRTSIITTPNREFNVFFPHLVTSGNFRHWDHKFEWTRIEFQSWCQHISSTFNYSVSFDGVGLPPSFVHGDVGHCTQIAIFERNVDLTDLSSLEISPSKTDLPEAMYTFHYIQRVGPEKKFEIVNWHATEDESRNEDGNEQSMTSCEQ
jgi:hypothetical protein